MFRGRKKKKSLGHNIGEMGSSSIHEKVARKNSKKLKAISSRRLLGGGGGGGGWKEDTATTTRKVASENHLRSGRYCNQGKIGGVGA